MFLIELVFFFQFETFALPHDFFPLIAPAFGFSSTTFSGSEASGQVTTTIVVTNNVALSQDFTVTLTTQTPGGSDGASFCKGYDLYKSNVYFVMEKNFTKLASACVKLESVS